MNRWGEPIIRSNCECAHVQNGAIWFLYDILEVLNPVLLSCNAFSHKTQQIMRNSCFYRHNVCCASSLDPIASFRFWVAILRWLRCSRIQFWFILMQSNHDSWHDSLLTISSLENMRMNISWIDKKYFFVFNSWTNFLNKMIFVLREI